MNLKFWYEYSSIILLHSQGIPSPAHFRYGWARSHVSCIQKIVILCLTLAAHCSGKKPSYSFYIESVK